jgi:demethylmenaquinone methyltransferase/2-methoxy-6-polyprenyl-1,4-benzoquinol methylase
MNRFAQKGKEWLDTPDRKRAFNAAHFAAAAPRYDVATIAMSFGMDRRWKRHLVAGLPMLAQPCCLDLACGTGDLSRMVAERYPDGQIIGIDLSREMLELAAARGGPLHLCYLQGDMHALPLTAGSCDLVTGSYALRNAPDLDCALAEISRVLRPGGHAAFLDFSKAVTPRGQHWQYSLLRFWCGLWGRLLSGSWEVHGYIAESLRRFPAGEELVRLMRLHDLELLVQKRYFCGMLQLLQLRRTK